MISNINITTNVLINVVSSKLYNYFMYVKKRGVVSIIILPVLWLYITVTVLFWVSCQKAVVIRCGCQSLHKYMKATLTTCYHSLPMDALKSTVAER